MLILGFCWLPQRATIVYFLGWNMTNFQKLCCIRDVKMLWKSFYNASFRSKKHFSNKIDFQAVQETNIGVFRLNCKYAICRYRDTIFVFYIWKPYIFNSCDGYNSLQLDFEVVILIWFWIFIKCGTKRGVTMNIFLKKKSP